MVMQRVTMPTKETPWAAAATSWSSLLNRSTRSLQRKCACGGVAGLTGECESCRRAISAAGVTRDPAPGSGAPAIVHEVVRGGGQPLDDQTRGFMEPRF